MRAQHGRDGDPNSKLRLGRTLRDRKAIYPYLLKHRPRIRRIVEDALRRALQLSGGDAKSVTLDEMLAATNQVWNEHCSKVIDALTEHYGISSDDPQKWQQLAFELAADHIPGLQLSDRRSVGRPRKLSPTRIKRSRGRPKDQARHRALLVLRMVALDVTREKELSGRGAQRRASELFVKRAAKLSGRSMAGDSWLVPKVEKLLSEAKSRFPGTDPEALHRENRAILFP